MNDLLTVKSVMEKEMLAIEHMVSGVQEDVQVCIDLMYQCRGKVIFCGVGKSGHIGKKLAATFASTGTSAFFVHASEAMHGDLGMIQKEDIIVLLSHSGTTEEIVKVAIALEKAQYATIAMCSDPNSMLVTHCRYALLYPKLKEADYLMLAPTVSSTLMLVLGDAIACALMEKRKFSESDFFQYHPGGSLGKQLKEKLYE